MNQCNRYSYHAYFIDIIWKTPAEKKRKAANTFIPNDISRSSHTNWRMEQAMKLMIGEKWRIIYWFEYSLNVASDVYMLKMNHGYYLLKMSLMISEWREKYIVPISPQVRTYTRYRVSEILFTSKQCHNTRIDMKQRETQNTRTSRINQNNKTKPERQNKNEII